MHLNFSDVRSSEFKECQLLIPHLGSIKPKELDIYKNTFAVIDQKNSVIGLDKNLDKNYFLPMYNDDKETAFYRNHLGILGLCTLISSLKARSDNDLKMVVISEYGEEMSLFRRDLTKSLSALFDDVLPPVKIITGDIGLQIDLTKVMASQWSIEEEDVDGNGVISYNYNTGK